MTEYIRLTKKQQKKLQRFARDTNKKMNKIDFSKVPKIDYRDLYNATVNANLLIWRRYE